ncbi:unnamed protein product [Meloidogyne enterolobii]|uniref:Uncharacterized protein n=1 Tax=Meloidogyne enterolobii TaxID=390850 RepID=A0ACB0Z5F3_MELEN
MFLFRFYIFFPYSKTSVTTRSLGEEKKKRRNSSSPFFIRLHTFFYRHMFIHSLLFKINNTRNKAPKIAFFRSS